MVKEKSLGVVVGRFQLPTLHPGHRELLDLVTMSHEQTLVVCGYDKAWPQVKDLSRQPYPLEVQKQIVQSCYPNVLLGAIPDSGGRPELWSTMLDEIVAGVASEAGAILYGSRDSFIPLYTGKFPIREIPTHGDYSATAVREQYANVLLNNELFRQGWLAAVAQLHLRTQ
jgi:bifunctional NMN adenylyltransferase/nudix hydrolase